MKKATSVLGYTLFALTFFLPFGVILFNFFSYTFELTNYSVFAIITGLSAIATVVLSGVDRKPAEDKAMSVLLSLTAPLSIINAVFYLSKCATVFVAVCMLVCACCCIFLAIKHGKPLALKIVAVVLSVLMLFPVGVLGCFALIFGNFGQNTVVLSVESPNGIYYAEVIDSDQGALGGNTYVDVHENTDIDALIFKLSKKTERIYNGNYAEFENMEIYWKDDHCLVINSVEYTIK